MLGWFWGLLIPEEISGFHYVWCFRSSLLESWWFEFMVMRRRGGLWRLERVLRPCLLKSCQFDSVTQLTSSISWWSMIANLASSSSWMSSFYLFRAIVLDESWHVLAEVCIEDHKHENRHQKTKLNYEQSYSAPVKEGERCHEAMWGLPAPLSKSEREFEERRDLGRALRRPGVHFSTTLAQNQPGGLLGDGLQFDLSAVKRDSVGQFRNLLYSRRSRA